MIIRQLIPGSNADILFLHTDTPTVKTEAEQNLFKFGGAAIAGIEKLAQRVALRLMTPLNGQPYDSFEGAQLMTDAIAGRLRTVDQVQVSFARAKESLLDQFAEDVRRYPETPAEEQLSDLELLDVEVNGDEVYLQIEITSAANGVFTLTQPITVV